MWRHLIQVSRSPLWRPSSRTIRPFITVHKCYYATNSDPKTQNAEKIATRPLSEFKIPPHLEKALLAKGIKTLFPIQAETYDVCLQGSDLIGRALTGTGKTLAFAIPIIERLSRPDLANVRGPKALILTPTRELCLQITQEIKSITHLQVHAVYGGTSVMAQGQGLRSADIVVGTPGRVKDFLDRMSLVPNAIKIAVLDEADRMLDNNFSADVEIIFAQLPSTRQTLLYSATIPSWIKSVAQNYMKDPLFIDLVGTNELRTPENVKHVALVAPTKKDLMQVLAAVVKKHVKDRGIIFTETKLDCSITAEALEGSAALHGDIRQGTRERILDDFRSGKLRVLVATDVASRGLDIPEVDCVIQFGLRADIETYVHRAGRCGRAGRMGSAVTLITSDKLTEIRALEHTLDIKFEMEKPTEDMKSKMRANPGPNDEYNDLIEPRQRRNDYGGGGSQRRNNDYGGGGSQRRNDYGGGGSRRNDRDGDSYTPRRSNYEDRDTPRRSNYEDRDSPRRSNYEDRGDKGKRGGYRGRYDKEDDDSEF